MHSTLCTIGFAGKTAAEFFRLLQEAGVQKVLDIREKRSGQLSGFAKHPNLAFFLERIAGIAYAHEPLLAPTPEIRKAYRQSRDWAQYEISFLELMKQRNIPESLDPAGFASTVVLLCSEPGPEKCHRRLVADLLAEHFRSPGHSVEIRHLAIEKAAGKAQRVRKRSPRQ